MNTVITARRSWAGVGYSRQAGEHDKPSGSGTCRGGWRVTGVGTPLEVRMPLRVLVVDDSREARELARRALESEGFEVDEAADGGAALTSVADKEPDLVLLDLAMPGISGLEVLTQIRRSGTLPVMVLSGRGEESERVLALELGADDYVVKPFLVRELPARIRSVLRRSGGTSAPPALDFGRLVVRIPEREVLLDGAVVELTPREFDLLAKLASSPRRVFSRDDLLKEVWGSSLDWQDPATVTEHVRRLRRKIEEDPEQPRWIQTVRGVGYRFEP
jgi:two-component system, OmpR family, phosphate regulon response regulator PhoB